MQDHPNKVVEVVIDEMIKDGVDAKMEAHRGLKLNHHERRALAKLQRKDEKLNRRIQQLESTLKRKPQ